MKKSELEAENQRLWVALAAARDENQKLTEALAAARRPEEPPVGSVILQHHAGYSGPTAFVRTHDGWVGRSGAFRDWKWITYLGFKVEVIHKP